MAGMMVGTASYMPPEQAMGGETTFASDLYALGCVLYEMVTGRPPFVGDDTVAVISQHVNTAPVSPAWHRPECPPALEALILRLLEKDPKQRPARASEVSEALAAVQSASTPAPVPAAEQGGEEHSNPIYRRTFVGRETELKQLEAAFDASLSGQGSLVMIAGEPGIGKTTITEQLATYVGMRGGQSLVGHCYEEGSLSIPYLAFVEIMRSYVTNRDRDELVSQLGSGAGEVARIVSEVRDRVNVPPSAGGSPDEERFRLFQAVAGFLRNASSAQPLCLVLEDLHDGDKGSLEMLVYLARNLAGARILLVGTYRDVEVDRTHPLSTALADLRRIDSFKRIALRGLSPDEVTRMISHIAGQDIPFELGEAIYRQTEGNPLFVQEVIRNAAEEGLITREGGQWVATVDSLINYIPEGLRDVIGRRLSRLSEECSRVIAIAAIIGRDFAVDVLRSVADVSEDELLAALEEAINVSLIEEMRGQRELRYRFTHAFFRQTLYEEMIAPRRLRMHNEVAKALETHYAGRVEEHATELAEHFSHSSSEEDLYKAVKYGRMAAERAASVFAFGEASRLLEQAIQVQEIFAPNDADEMYDLFMALGRAWLSNGEPQRVLADCCPRALELADKIGGGAKSAWVGELAAWSLTYQGLASFLTPEFKQWCDVMDVNAPPDSRERVIANNWRAWITWASKDVQASWSLRKQTVDMARRVNEPESLLQALFGFTVPGGPIRWDQEKLQAAREIIDLPRGAIPPGTVGQILWSIGDTLLDSGDVKAAERAWQMLDDYVALVEDPYVLSWQAFAKACRTYLAGDLEGAVKIGTDNEARAESLGAPVWGRLVAGWCTMPSLLRLGASEEILSRIWTLDILPYGATQSAATKAACGQIEEAAASLVPAYDKLQQLGPDWADRVTLTNLFDLAIRCENLPIVEDLYSRLVDAMPYSHNTGGITNANMLGRAACVMGDWSKARTHFDDGLAVATEMGHRPEIAVLNYYLADLLFEHFPDDKAAAAEHLNFATQEAQAMKMKPLLNDCLALKLRFQGITSTDLDTSIDTVASKALAEQPDLRTRAAPDGTVTIMFSDIEGSTEKTAALGDTKWMEVLKEHGAIIREQLKAHDGFEVKSEGDGFMLAFQSARKALQCAVAMQRAFEAHNERAETPVRTRMGLHTGEVIKDGDDFFGIHVNLAARVASKATGGEILASSLLKELTASGGDIEYGDPRTVEFKGIEGQHQVWPVEWRAS
jgi:class 3 adenylate cyclase